MKKFKTRVLLICILTTIMSTAIVSARAGGGSGGGGGGGSSSGGRGSSNSSSNSEESAYVNPLGIVLLIIVSTGGAITYKINLNKKKSKSIKLIKKINKNDKVWDYKKIHKDVENTFYIVQKAWTELDQDIAKDYCTKELNDRHSTKLQWMEIRNERNVLDKIKLKDVKIIGVEDYKDDNEDTIWVYIKASMIDYLLKDEHTVEENSYDEETFKEYWKFKRVNDKWLLDEIKQTDEVDNLDEFDIKSEEI